MRLSDIKGERTLDVVAEIMGPVIAIVTDEEMIAEFKLASGADKGAAAKLAPKLIKSHRADVISILAAIEGVEAEKYAESLTLAKLIKDVTDVLTDESLFTFFESPKAAGEL